MLLYSKRHFSVRMDIKCQLYIIHGLYITEFINQVWDSPTYVTDVSWGFCIFPFCCCSLNCRPYVICTSWINRKILCISQAQYHICWGTMIHVEKGLICFSDLKWYWERDCLACCRNLHINGIHMGLSSRSDSTPGAIPSQENSIVSHCIVFGHRPLLEMQKAQLNIVQKIYIICITLIDSNISFH